MTPSARSSLTQGMALLILTVLTIAFAKEAFAAALEALRLFAGVVFPSLLPFFLLSEVLLAYGVVHFLGECFEPLMRPLFNVPGVGSFVLSMGLAAGYPMDAVVTARFRRDGLCTKAEGERLLAFTNTADPLFLLSAVAVGMLGRPELGALLALAHYGSAFLVGITFRFWGGREGPPPRQAPKARRPIWRRAVEALLAARRADGRNLPTVLKDAAADSLATLFLILAYIVLFSVLLAVLEKARVLRLLLPPFALLLHLLHLDPHLARGLLAGVLEIDIGANALAHTPTSLAARATLISAVVAWSGLSVQGQVASVLAGTDISLFPYVLARILHSVLSGLLTALFFPLFGRTQGVLLVAHALGPSPGAVAAWGALCLFGLFGSGVALALLQAIRIVRLRIRL